MELDRAARLRLVEEVLVGGVWVPIITGSYIEEGEHVRYKELSHADVVVRRNSVDGFKANTLRGKLEGG